MPAFLFWARLGEDIRLVEAVDRLANLETRACCAFRLVVDVLVGGGVCIELAERIDDAASSSMVVFNGVSSISEARWLECFVVEEGLGDEVSRREGSTGGKALSGFGERWWT